MDLAFARFIGAPGKLAHPDRVDTGALHHGSIDSPAFLGPLLWIVLYSVIHREGSNPNNDIFGVGSGEAAANPKYIIVWIVFRIVLRMYWKCPADYFADGADFVHQGGEPFGFERLPAV